MCVCLWFHQQLRELQYPTSGVHCYQDIAITTQCVQDVCYIQVGGGGQGAGEKTQGDGR